MTLDLRPPVDYPEIEDGYHVARCVQVIDIGTHWQNKFESSEQELKHQVSINFEVPEFTYEYEGKTTCKMIPQRYSATLSKKGTLRKHLNSWRGKTYTDEDLKNFTLKSIVGLPAYVMIEKTASGFPKIVNITPLPKGIECPPQVREGLWFDIDNIADVTEEFLSKLTKGNREMIETSQEAQHCSDFPFSA
jgi:hypothetical protein